jgi:hypothetical protein
LLTFFSRRAVMRDGKEQVNDRRNPANRPDADDPGNDTHQHEGGRKSGHGDRGVDDELGEARERDDSGDRDRKP